VFILLLCALLFLTTKLKNRALNGQLDFLLCLNFKLNTMRIILWVLSNISVPCNSEIQYAMNHEYRFFNKKILTLMISVFLASWFLLHK